MEPDSTLTTVGQAVQLSLAPVFLLSGVGAMLAVMTNRLTRIVDRGRAIESRLEQASPAETVRLRAELASLVVRMRITSRAIALCTITALFVCALVITMFIGAFLKFRAAIAVALLFVAAMVTFFIGLLNFLREVFMATASLRLDELRLARATAAAQAEDGPRGAA
jgi:hypothetical protein